MIQTGTLGHWDHIGIVVRRRGHTRQFYEANHTRKAKRRCNPGYCTCRCESSSERLELLEATAAGVHVYPLEERLARRMKIDKFVAVRKLERHKLRARDGSESVSLLEKRMEGYIEKVAGAGYISAQQFLATTLMPTMRNRSQRLYFCSGMVAGALKHTGVLDEIPHTMIEQVYEVMRNTAYPL